MIKYIVLAFLLMIPTFAMAEDDEGGQSLSMAVVDVQRLMNDSLAAKSIQSQGKKLKEKYQKRIVEIEKDLKESEQNVIEASKDKDEKSFVERRKDFEKDLMEGQKEYRALNQKLDKSVASALEKLRDNIVSIVKDIAKKEGYDVVLTHADVITVAKPLDITDAVLKRLNEDVSSIKVKE